MDDRVAPVDQRLARVPDGDTGQRRMDSAAVCGYSVV